MSYPEDAWRRPPGYPPAQPPVTPSPQPYPPGFPTAQTGPTPAPHHHAGVPQPWSQPNGAQGPYPPWAPPRSGSPDAWVMRAVLIVVGTVFGILAIFIAKSLVFALIDGAFAGNGWFFVLLLLFVMTLGGCYIAYRSKYPDDARRLESRLKDTSLATLNRISYAIDAKTSGTGAPGQHMAPRSMAPHPVVPPVPPTAWVPQPPPVSPGVAPAWGGGATGTVDPAAREVLVSAALIAPSVIAYALIRNVTSYTTPWQPWAVNLVFDIYVVACVGLLARNESRRLPAILLALLATGITAFSTAPSTFGYLRNSILNSTSSGSYVQPNYLTWLIWLPTIAIFLFAVAWGVARRRNSGWVVGLVPSIFFLVISIWYREHHIWDGSLGWFHFWLMDVGLFVACCLVCWVVDVISGPRPQPQTNGPRW
jgi:hypothetical protein